MKKNKSVDEILASINPKTAASFRKASEVEYEYLKTPSLGINMAIGGIRYGGFTTLYGNRGCGKTAFALQCVADAQKNGKNAVWFDIEKNFDATWAARLGVDTDKIYIDNQTISMAAMADKTKDAVFAGFDVIVIDSISQLLPQSYFEDAKEANEEIKGLAATGQIGTFSKNIGQALNIINAVNQKSLIILISQVRNQIGSYGASIGFQGGKAIEHASSTIVKFWRSTSDVITKDVNVGNGLLLKRPVGSSVTWTMEKNRGSGMGWSNKYDLYSEGEDVGVGQISEIVTYGIEFGYIKKSGSWITIGEESIQGKEQAVQFIRENPEIKAQLYNKILGKSE